MAEAEKRHAVADTRFEVLMKAWGIAYAEPPEPEDFERRSRASNPIAINMEFAPGKKPRKKSRPILGRDGRSRHKILAQNVGLKGLTSVPTAFTDPVRCKETRSFKITTEHPVSPELQKIQQAVKDLEQIKFIRALCLRVNYCTEGTHKDKAAAVNKRIRTISKGHEGISVDVFRDELLYGKIWVHGRIYSPEPVRQSA